jgi:hypothetical protein
MPEIILPKSRYFIGGSDMKRVPQPYGGRIERSDEAECPAYAVSP